MEYNRSDFIKVAATGLAVAGGGWLFSGAALAREEPHRAYSQAQADRIHARSMERAIRQAGEDPEEIKAEVNRRMLALREDMERSGDELRDNLGRSIRAI
jgi:F0F1-type ATP synthase membrane subunit b/b'